MGLREVVTQGQQFFAQSILRHGETAADIQGRGIVVQSDGDDVHAIHNTGQALTGADHGTQCQLIVIV